MKKSFLTLLAMVLVFGLSFIACDNGNGDKTTTYTVTFNSNGGSAVSPITGLSNGATITKPANPTRDGFEFTGWYLDNYTFNTAWQFDNFTITANITLYAKWTYTVTFNSNGGSAISPITNINNGEKIAKPSDPTKPNFDFNGWYTDNTTFTNAWNFATDTVTASITLYAKWDFQYALGDTGPGGGKIFYRSVSGFTMTDDNSTAYYLEAAPTDMPPTLRWVAASYGTQYTTFPDITGTETAIGTGRKNTSLILATDADAPATKACNEYTNNGKNDWFLPSKDELNELYKSKDSVGNLKTILDETNWSNFYWSSSQDTHNRYAWDQDFNNGLQSTTTGGKNYTYSVRAVRAF